MTTREATIIEMYTGVVMLTGNNRKHFYEYAKELLGFPIHTHEYPDYGRKDRQRELGHRELRGVICRKC